MTLPIIHIIKNEDHHSLQRATDGQGNPKHQNHTPNINPKYNAIYHYLTPTTHYHNDLNGTNHTTNNHADKEITNRTTKQNQINKIIPPGNNPIPKTIVSTPNKLIPESVVKLFWNNYYSVENEAGSKDEFVLMSDAYEHFNHCYSTEINPSTFHHLSTKIGINKIKVF